MNRHEAKIAFLLKYLIVFAIAIIITLAQDLIVAKASTAIADKRYQYEQELIQRGEVPEGYIQLKCGRIIKGELAPPDIQELDVIPEGYVKTTCGTVIKDQLK